MKEFGPLRNPRHEKFAQLVWQADAKNYRRGLAYQAAGYRASLDDKSKSCSADACAHRLFKNAQVQRRIREISVMAAKRNEVTEDSLIGELEQARIAALEAQQASAAVAATMGKAKVCGLLVERKETGKPGDFDSMTVEELRQYLSGAISETKQAHDGNDTED
jgi:hypothetical protein